MNGPEMIRAMVDSARPWAPRAVRANGASLGDDSAPAPLWRVPAAASADEWTTARIAPRCIVENYLFADVATLIAPGGTGKTTATLFEAVCIALGLALWGLRVVTPGPVLIVTAEDRREFLVARLREICIAMRLDPAQTAQVRELVRIDDRTATTLRRLTAIVSDVVAVADFADAIVAGCEAAHFAPVLAQFDPMVSFGVGESRVNDAEQGLIDAARVITGGLDCCTRYVHHSGKGPALDKRGDQYAGRGGSALADGCRMVSVMHAADGPELGKATGRGLAEGESAFVLHRPKVSYAAPQAPVYVVRHGFGFTHAPALDADARGEAEAEAQRVRDADLRGALLDATETAHAAGLPLTPRGLIERVRGFKTDDKRASVAQLLAEAWLIEAAAPAGWRLVNNARRSFLVRLTASERETYKAAGALPADKMRPPPSIATPAERGAA